jgi:hypothetical protein
MLGRLLYLCYYQPRGELKALFRRGIWNSYHAKRGQKAMLLAAHSLPPIPREGTPSTPPVTFLTGNHFWFQTAFCLWSLQRVVREPLQFDILDDGTLTRAQAGFLTRLTPHITIHWNGDTEARLAEVIPASRFPALHARRKNFPLLRKLTDVHAGRRGPRLFLDSDMLFFREPTVLLDWLHDPRVNLHMVDVDTYYGYSRPLMEQLAGAPVPDRINSGISGLQSDQLDWKKIDHWLATLELREGTHYLAEQAMTAMLIAGNQERIPLPTGDYLCAPSPAECQHPTAALHHYVSDSKLSCYRYSWPLLLKEKP